MRSLLIWLVLCSATYATEPQPPAQSPQELQAIKDIKAAFTEGGPLVSCWNVQAGWDLTQQVEWIKAGHRYFPTIYCPLLQQGANNPAKWDGYFAEHGPALAYINANKLPVTLRWHNFGIGFYDNEIRPPLEQSALVWYRKADGTLDDKKLLDHMAPSEPWTNEGTNTAKSLWMQKLVEVLPDVPRFYCLENNETALAELGYYTNPSDLDPWRIRNRTWKPSMGSLSVRMEGWAATHNANDLEPEIEKGFIRLRKAFWDAFHAHLPAAMQGKSYGGGYGGEIGLEYGLGQNGRQKWSYLRPQENWTEYPYGAAIWDFHEPSERIYDDGSGSPWNWHDWVRGPHILRHNTAPVSRYASETRPLWHNDISTWISPQRSRMASVDHGGYVLPDRAKGFYRAIQWSVISRGRADVQRYFAASQTELTNQWFDAPSDPPELSHLTQLDYFNSCMRAVDEVWEEPELLRFWQNGVPVLNPDPSLCQWELPPDVLDDRSRVLYTDADPPRFDATGVDLWQKTDGKMELKVFAQAYRIGNNYLVYAWSPRQTRENVTVQVPGLEGGVLFDTVDQDGEFRIIGGMMAIH